jgi:hypothetical protein
MNLRPVGLVLAAALAACAAGGGAPPPDPASVLRAVATDIEALGARHAQLAAFRAADHLDLAQARIDYAWHTHAAARTGGWTSGVPAPDADGIWLYIDVHDPASTLQIHTQPVVERLCLAGARVSLLVLEGDQVDPAAGELRRILERHGVRRC